MSRSTSSVSSTDFISCSSRSWANKREEMLRWRDEMVQWREKWREGMARLREKWREGMARLREKWRGKMARSCKTCRVIECGHVWNGCAHLELY